MVSTWVPTGTDAFVAAELEYFYTEMFKAQLEPKAKDLQDFENSLLSAVVDRGYSGWLSYRYTSTPGQSLP